MDIHLPVLGATISHNLTVSTFEGSEYAVREPHNATTTVSEPEPEPEPKLDPPSAFIFLP